MLALLDVTREQEHEQQFKLEAAHANAVSPDAFKNVAAFSKAADLAQAVATVNKTAVADADAGAGGDDDGDDADGGDKDDEGEDL